MKKKSKTQDYLEAKVLYKHGGKIDFKKLWKSEEDIEAEPSEIEALIKQA